VAALMLAMAAGGCATQGTLTNIADTTDFQHKVIEAKGPVIVDFYKDGCPTCVLQEVCVERLADEYGRQVTFTKFKVREATMISSCPEFMDQHQLFWVPTVILFVDGKEKQRWELNHGEEDFRPALDDVIRKAGRQAPPPRNALPESSAILMSDSNKCIPGQGCPINAAH